MAFEDGPLAPGWGFCPARLWVRCVGASLSLLLCNGTSPAAACPAVGRVGRVDRRVHQLPPGDVTRQPHRGRLLRCLGSAGRRALSAGCGLGGAGHGKPRSSAFPSASRPACNRACGSEAACTPIAFMRWEGPRCFCLEAAGRVGRHPARPACASRRPACVARAFRGLWAGEAGRNPGHSPCLFLSVCAHSHVRLRRRAWAAWWRAERARVPRMCMLPAGLVRLVCLARRGTLRRLRAA